MARICEASLGRRVGVYVHGSTALGGFGPASDLDVLVITEGHADWSPLGARLLAEAGGPRPLELSVVAAEAALGAEPPWSYHLHVNSGESRFGLGAGREDPDLVAHYAVARAAGIAVVGPPADSAFGPVPQDLLVAYLRGELASGVEVGDERYAVLNTCRAVAYVRSGRLLSKLDGGTWWLEHVGPSALVERSLAAQREGVDLGTATAAARSFVHHGLATL